MPISARSRPAAPMSRWPGLAAPTSRLRSRPRSRSPDPAASICSAIPRIWTPTLPDRAGFTSSAPKADRPNQGDVIMAFKLATIAVIGLVTSAACMGAAAAIGGPGFDDGFGGMFDSRPRCETIPNATQTVRDLEWRGGNHVTLAVPAQANYSPRNGGTLHASGDPQIVAHLRV